MGVTVEYTLGKKEHEKLFQFKKDSEITSLNKNALVSPLTFHPIKSKTCHVLSLIHPPWIFLKEMPLFQKSYITRKPTKQPSCLHVGQRILEIPKARARRIRRLDVFLMPGFWGVFLFLEKKHKEKHRVEIWKPPLSPGFFGEGCHGRNNSQISELSELLNSNFAIRSRGIKLVIRYRQNMS